MILLLISFKVVLTQKNRYSLFALLRKKNLFFKEYFYALQDDDVK